MDRTQFVFASSVLHSQQSISLIFQFSSAGRLIYFILIFISTINYPTNQPTTNKTPFYNRQCSSLSPPLFSASLPLPPLVSSILRVFATLPAVLLSLPARMARTATDLFPTVNAVSPTPVLSRMLAQANQARPVVVFPVETTVSKDHGILIVSY